MTAKKVVGATTALRSRNRPRVGSNTGKLFFNLWLKQPTVIGAAIPSGTALARAMASQVAIDPDRIVVELGGGTGAITAALLERGVDPDKLVVVEQNPDLLGILKTRFPRVRIVGGDASRLRQLFRAHGLWSKGAAKAVVSSLPVIPMPRTVQHRILTDCFELTGPDGVFIQFTYGLFSPLSHAVIAGQELRVRRVAFAWTNLPPASVWRFEKRLRRKHPDNWRMRSGPSFRRPF